MIRDRQGRFMTKPSQEEDLFISFEEYEREQQLRKERELADEDFIMYVIMRDNSAGE